jgi:hypothetical protein
MSEAFGELWMGEFFLNFERKKLGFGTAYQNK